MVAQVVPDDARVTPPYTVHLVRGKRVISISLCGDCEVTPYTYLSRRNLSENSYHDSGPDRTSLQHRSITPAQEGACENTYP